MSSELTKNEILEADDLGREKVEVPEWGGHLWVRALSGDEREGFEASMMVVNKKGDRELRIKNMRSGLVARAACTTKGTRVFAESDIPALSQKSAAALERVYVVAARLSGLTPEDEEKLVQDFSEAAAEDSTTP